MTPVTEKIRKLLRMSHGGSPHEIAAAMRLAQKLAAESGIDIESIDASLDHGRYKVRHHVVAHRGNIPMEIHAAGYIVKRWVPVDFAIKSMSGGPRYALLCIGSDYAREIGSYLITYLAREFGRAWRTRPNRRLRDKHSFLAGMVAGVETELEKFAPPPPPPPAEMLQAWGNYLETINLYLERSPSQRAVRFNNSALLAGAIAGQAVRVNRPCAAAMSSQPSLLSP